MLSHCYLNLLTTKGIFTSENRKTYTCRRSINWIGRNPVDNRAAQKANCTPIFILLYMTIINDLASNHSKIRYLLRRIVKISGIWRKIVKKLLWIITYEFWHFNYCVWHKNLKPLENHPICKLPLYVTFSYKKGGRGGGGKEIFEKYGIHVQPISFFVRECQPRLSAFPWPFLSLSGQACSVVHRFDALSIPLFARARKTPSPAAAAAHNTRRSTTDLTSQELAGIDRHRDRCCPVFPLITPRGWVVSRAPTQPPLVGYRDATTDRDRQPPLREENYRNAPPFFVTLTYWSSPCQFLPPRLERTPLIGHSRVTIRFRADAITITCCSMMAQLLFFFSFFFSLLINKVMNNVIKKRTAYMWPNFT